MPKWNSDLKKSIGRLHHLNLNIDKHINPYLNSDIILCFVECNEEYFCFSPPKLLLLPNLCFTVETPQSLEDDSHMQSNSWVTTNQIFFSTASSASRELAYSLWTACTTWTVMLSEVKSTAWMRVTHRGV